MDTQAQNSPDGGAQDNLSSVSDDGRPQGHVDQLKATAEQMKEGATQLGNQATDALRTGKQEALAMAEERKASAAEKMSGIAKAIETAAAELQQQMPTAANYIRDAAAGVEQFSSRIKDGNLEDLMRELNGFAHRHPVALLGTSLLAGFAVSRFLKSSDPAKAQTNESYANAPTNQSLPH